MTTDLNTPLSREEMATYISYMDENLQTTAQSMKTYCDTQTSAFNTVINTMTNTFDNKISELSDTLEKLIAGQKDLITVFRQTQAAGKTNISSKSNSLFSSSWDTQKQILWIKKVRGRIADLCLKENKIEGVIYKEIYASMKQEGYDVDDLLKEYKITNNKSDIISMLASSDILRGVFERNISKCTINKTTADSKNIKSGALSKPSFKKNCPSEIAKYTPDNVRNIVARLARDGKPTIGTYRMAYDLLGIDKKALIKETEERTGLKRVVLGYAIGSNPSMVAKLDNAISEYLKKNGGETR